MVRLFLICFGLLIFPQLGQADTYLLTEPLQQTVAMDTPLRKSIFVGTVLADLAWTMGNTYVYYQVTNEPFSTIGYGLYNLASGVTFINAEVRMQEELIARLARRKEIKKFAEAQGAKEIRVLSTGHFQQTTPYSTTLHAKSFVFLDSDAPPTEGNWQKIDLADDPKIRLELKVPQNPGALPAWESSLEDLFAGTTIPDDVLASWNEPLAEFSKERSLWQRWVTKSGLAGLEIRATLLADGKEIPLGPLATDSGVFRFLEGGKLQAWNNKFRALLQLPKKPVAVKTGNTRVIRSKGCSSWFQRLLGNEVVPNSAKD
jgi:hypothetical protein